MQHRYGGEWLLIDCEELNENLDVVRGEVIAHSPDKSEIYNALAANRRRDCTLAIEYAGEFPNDVAYLL